MLTYRVTIAHPSWLAPPRHLRLLRILTFPFFAFVSHRRFDTTRTGLFSYRYKTCARKCRRLISLQNCRGGGGATHHRTTRREVAALQEDTKLHPGFYPLNSAVRAPFAPLRLPPRPDILRPTYQVSAATEKESLLLQKNSLCLGASALRRTRRFCTRTGNLVAATCAL
jgi:hypothetical protein